MLTSELVYALKPEQWCKEILHVELDAWQAEFMKAKRNQHIRASRRIGKSFVCAAKALHKAVMRPGCQIILVAPTFSQAALLSEQIGRFLDGMQSRPKMLNESQSVLKFENGSIIRTLQGSEADSLRGYGADLIIMDESAFVQDLTWQAISPMVAITNGQIIAVSTPNGPSGWYYDLYASTNPNWDFLTLPWTICPRISPEFIEREKLQMPYNRFSQEYLTLWGDMDSALWSAEDISYIFE